MPKWPGKLREIRDRFADSWSDFCATISELAGEKTLPQILGVVVIVGAYCIVSFLFWALLSFLLGLVVWFLWNIVMPDLGLPEIHYWNAYCLTLLCAVLFRGNSIHLKE